ncbi:MAG: glycine cleavage system protein GcvH [Verrucomicrobia bacterium]|nr:glycine cleavage system protein GcvH [Verrucomicrobiota bacterium]
MKKTKTHEWVKLEGSVATVGITEFAAKEIGDIVYIEFPKVGALLKKGEEAAILESTKAAIDTYAPLSGKVLTVNPALQANPSLLTKEPLTNGWLYQIDVSHPEEYEEYTSLS